MVCVGAVKIVPLSISIPPPLGAVKYFEFGVANTGNVYELHTETVAISAEANTGVS